MEMYFFKMTIVQFQKTERKAVAIFKVFFS